MYSTGYSRWMDGWNEEMNSLSNVFTFVQIYSHWLWMNFSLLSENQTERCFETVGPFTDMEKTIIAKLYYNSLGLIKLSMWAQKEGHVNEAHHWHHNVDQSPAQSRYLVLWHHPRDILWTSSHWNHHNLLWHQLLQRLLWTCLCLPLLGYVGTAAATSIC